MPRAAVVHNVKEPMKIEEVQLRPLEDGDILVRVKACGLCHSDLSVLNEYWPTPLPAILGHEAAGVVEAVGASVRKVAVGDHVVAIWRPSCGQCRYCRKGKQHLCVKAETSTTDAAGRIMLNGQGVNQFLGVGGFSEYVIWTEASVVKIDPQMPMEKAALLGCAVVTGYGAAVNTVNVAEGDEVAVFGCGGVGLNIIQGARAAGAGKIVAIDVDEDKFALARKFGATHTIKAGGEKLEREIKALTDENQGVDYAFDAVGSTQIDETAFKSICKGGSVVLVGIAHRAQNITLPQLQAAMSEKVVRGSVQGSIPADVAIPQFVTLYQKGNLLLDDLMTRTYKLEEINEGFQALRDGKTAGRGVIVFD